MNRSQYIRLIKVRIKIALCYIQIGNIKYFVKEKNEAE